MSYETFRIRVLELILGTTLIVVTLYLLILLAGFLFSDGNWQYCYVRTSSFEGGRNYVVLASIDWDDDATLGIASTLDDAMSIYEANGCWGPSRVVEPD